MKVRTALPFRRLVVILFFEGSLVLSQTNDLIPGARANQPNTVDSSPCIRPARLFSAADYAGPFNKAVVYFSRKPEIKTVDQHHRGTGLSVCALTAPEKFRLFIANNTEPVTFLGAAFSSGLAQAQNQDRKFGQGAPGYAKRYGSAITDSASSDLFHTFVFPVVFRQDPRYYRQLEGGAGARLSHAMSHVFVARGDSGAPMFNFSEWLGTASTIFLSNAYHPGNPQGLRPAARRLGINIATDAASDALREYWPEIVHSLRLPFREQTTNNHKRKEP